MKNILVVLILSFITIHSYCQQNAIKFDVVSPLSGKIRLDYETSLSDIISLQFAFQSGRIANEQLDESTYRLNSTGILTEIRAYPFLQKNTAPFGFFVGGGFRYMRYGEVYNRFGWKQQGTGTYHNVGLDIGYKLNYHRICIEVLAGYGTGSVKPADRNRDFTLPQPYSSILYDEKKFIRAEISLGYLFPKSRKVSSASEIDSGRQFRSSERSKFGGVKAGGSLNKTKYRELPSGFEHTNVGRVGFHVGLFAAVPLSRRLSIGTEVQYSQQMRSYEALEVPVMLSYSMTRLLAVEAGPFARFLLDYETVRRGAVGESYESIVDFGWAAGLRLQLNDTLSFGGRYYCGLNGTVQFYDDMGMPTPGVGYNRQVQISSFVAIF
jgi:hypothetical protein